MRTSTSRYRKVKLQFFPKKLKFRIEIGDGAITLRRSIDFMLQFRDSNQITLGETFTKLDPNVSSILEEDNGLSYGGRNGIQDPRRDKLIATVPCSEGWIESITGNGNSTVNEVKLHLSAKSSLHGTRP
jgi:hypothetical protein